VEDVFREQIARTDGGASVAVYHRGRLVVDLWGGVRSVAGDPWTRDTLAMCWSTTKGVTATCAARCLYDAIDQWVFCALTVSPGARTFYDQHRAAGDLHHQALRALGNRFVGAPMRRTRSGAAAVRASPATERRAVTRRDDPDSGSGR
jgi:Beta-lactamase